MRAGHAIIGLVAVLLAAAALAACGSSTGGGNSSGAGKSPITFALIGMKTPGLDLLTGETAGAQAAAKEINAEGGFGGHKVVIDVCNSMAVPATAIDCAHSTLAKHPVAMFGCELAWGPSGAVQIYASEKVPSFNCVNTTQDYTNPWNFGLNDGGFGDLRGFSKWLCSQSAVHTVATLGADVPAEHQVIPSAEKVLNQCGKRTVFIYFPATATDYAPYIAKVLAQHPDFVQIQAPSSTSGVEIFQAFQQAGYPADKLSAASSAFDYETLKSAGPAVNGAYSTSEFRSWGETRDPEVAAYLKAMKGSPVNPRDVNPQTGYAELMWFYTVARKVGFDKFNSASLTSFMRTKSGVAMPMSRELINPGPSGYPQVKQPYTMIVQWKNGKLNKVTKGTDQGWIRGY
jgi:ABC-type branched-subunit amino acid transport system substrate-binding protein